MQHTGILFVTSHSHGIMGAPLKALVRCRNGEMVALESHLESILGGLGQVDIGIAIHMA